MLFLGIVVVPDENMVKKIPAVSGLMAYRKDNKKLYVRASESWNAVALEKKVTSVMAKLEQKLQKNLFQRLNGLGGISQSTILQANQRYITLLKHWLPFVFYRSKLCYRATRDGWASSNFHSRCDNKGPTVTIVKVGQYIFGGYTDRPWGGSRYIRSMESFIFSLRNYYGIGPFTASVYQYDNSATYSNPFYGPTFGGGFDLYISSNANSNTNSYTRFGYTYKPPTGYSYGSSNTKALLSGSFHFSPSEMEVFFS